MSQYLNNSLASTHPVTKRQNCFGDTLRADDQPTHRPLQLTDDNADGQFYKGTTLDYLDHNINTVTETKLISQ